MKITSFLEPIRDDGSATTLFGETGTPMLGHGRRIKRSMSLGKAGAAGKAGRHQDRLPDPPPLGPFGDDYDRVTPSLEATYLMIGDRYDPRSLALHDMIDMTDMLVAGHVITRSDQALLLRGPTGRGYSMTTVTQPRNRIAEWQDYLAQGVARSDLNAVSRATRALGIFGRVAATRLPI
jgi:hypothetical protein